MVASNIDIRRARADTPGCHRALHFNNAGAALMPKQVSEAVISHLQLETEMGGYEAAEHSAAAVEHVYDAASKLFNCRREEIAIMENATRAWDMAFYALSFKSGDRILTAESEYGSNYIAFLQMARRTGAKVEIVPSDQPGQISVKALEDMIDEHVKLIAITHIPSTGGLVNPATEVGKIAQQANILYLLDACQSAGQMPIDVQAIGCDMLTTTGRKFLRGPRGTSILFIRNDLIEKLEPPFLDLYAAKWFTNGQYEIRADARRFETWETNYAARIGLGVAIDYTLSWGLENIWARISDLSSVLRAQLSSNRHVKLQDGDLQQGGIVTFVVDGQEPMEIKRNLTEQKIHVSVSRAEHSPIYMEKRKIKSLVRASLHYYNNLDEIERFCNTIARLARS